MYRIVGGNIIVYPVKEWAEARRQELGPDKYFVQKHSEGGYYLEKCNPIILRDWLKQFSNDEYQKLIVAMYPDKLCVKYDNIQEALGHGVRWGYAVENTDSFAYDLLSRLWFKGMHNSLYRGL